MKAALHVRSACRRSSLVVAILVAVGGVRAARGRRAGRAARARCGSWSTLGRSATTRCGTRSRRCIETVLGFALAVVLAIVAAAAMDRAPAVRRAVEPLLVTSQTIPVVALAPLFLLWFGFGLVPKVLVVILVTFFPIVVALLDGFRSTSPEAPRTCCAPTARPTARRSASCAGRRRCRRSSPGCGSPSCTR